MDIRTPVLDIEHASLRLGATLILANVDLQVECGESVSIMGRSGSGKSSLLACILGLTKINAGIIKISGKTIRPSNNARFRKNIGMVYQTGELLPELTATENVMVAGLLGGMTPRLAATRAHELLAHLGISNDVPSVVELSGGERQRVAVARALINRPALILADEPTGALDDVTRDQVVETLFALPGRFGCALIVVTHDPVVAARASRRLRIDAGRVHTLSDAGSAE